MFNFYLRSQIRIKKTSAPYISVYQSWGPLEHHVTYHIHTHGSPKPCKCRCSTGQYKVPNASILWKIPSQSQTGILCIPHPWLCRNPSLKKAFYSAHQPDLRLTQHWKSPIRHPQATFWGYSSSRASLLWTSQFTCLSIPFCRIQHLDLVQHLLSYFFENLFRVLCQRNEEI